MQKARAAVTVLVGGTVSLMNTESEQVGAGQCVGEDKSDFVRHGNELVLDMIGDW